MLWEPGTASALIAFRYNGPNSLIRTWLFRRHKATILIRNGRTSYTDLRSAPSVLVSDIFFRSATWRHREAHHSTMTLIISVIVIIIIIIISETALHHRPFISAAAAAAADVIRLTRWGHY